MSALSTVPPKEQDIDGDNCIAGHDYESATTARTRAVASLTSDLQLSGANLAPHSYS